MTHRKGKGRLYLVVDADDLRRYEEQVPWSQWPDEERTCERIWNEEGGI